MSPRAQVRRVDEAGIDLAVRGEQVLDVLFDDRRIWSFWTLRDTRGTGRRSRTIDWPKRLRRYLDGVAVVTIRDHVSGDTLYREELTFGSGRGRIAIEAPDGTPLGLDKSGRMEATFDVRSPEETAPLLQAIQRVLAALEQAGVQPFLAYGTLLGAVRQGGFLGHDSDADLAYVSSATHPVDVVAESFRLQRSIAAMGFGIYRYSGGSFRVEVAEADGRVRGLDVFGGFFDGPRLYLMGEIGVPFRPEWIHPLGSRDFEGLPMPVPAVPERLLEVTYGADWRIPDPAFKFTTPASTIQRFDDWFRGLSRGRLAWERFYGRRARKPLNRRHSRLAARARDWVGAGGEILDVGAGSGADALWLAQAGIRVTAYDFVPRVLRDVRRLAARESLTVEARPLNLNDWRSVLGEGARAAHAPRTGRRAMLARHVADATDAAGREELVRFAAMALTGGGRLFLEVWDGSGEPPPRLEAVSVADLAARIERRGGRIVRVKQLRPGAGSGGRRHGIGRLVAQWD